MFCYDELVPQNKEALQIFQPLAITCDEK